MNIQAFAAKAATHCIRDFGTPWPFVSSEIRLAFIDAAILRLHNQRDDADLHSEDVQTLRDAVAAQLGLEGYTV